MTSQDLGGGPGSLAASANLGFYSSFERGGGGGPQSRSGSLLFLTGASCPANSCRGIYAVARIN